MSNKNKINFWLLYFLSIFIIMYPLFLIIFTLK